MAREGCRAWCRGQAISQTRRDLDLGYQRLNSWMKGFARARRSKIG